MERKYVLAAVIILLVGWFVFSWLYLDNLVSPRAQMGDVVHVTGWAVPASSPCIAEGQEFKFQLQQIRGFRRGPLYVNTISTGRQTISGRLVEGTHDAIIDRCFVLIP
jgi:hypothetical protein